MQAKYAEDDNVYRMSLYVPASVHTRWSEHVKQRARIKDFAYNISNGLKMMNVTSKEFAKCWQFMKKSTTDEELFCLLKDAGFGPPHAAIPPKVEFIRKVLQRYKDDTTVLFFGLYCI